MGKAVCQFNGNSVHSMPLGQFPFKLLPYLRFTHLHILQQFPPREFELSSVCWFCQEGVVPDTSRHHFVCTTAFLSNLLLLQSIGWPYPPHATSLLFTFLRWDCRTAVEMKRHWTVDSYHGQAAPPFSTTSCVVLFYSSCASNLGIRCPLLHRFKCCNGSHLLKR